MGQSTDGDWRNEAFNDWQYPTRVCSNRQGTGEVYPAGTDGLSLRVCTGFADGHADNATLSEEAVSDFHVPRDDTSYGI